MKNKRNPLLDVKYKRFIIFSHIKRKAFLPGLNLVFYRHLSVTLSKKKPCSGMLTNFTLLVYHLIGYANIAIFVNKN